MTISYRAGTYRRIEVAHSIARNMSNEGLCDALTALFRDRRPLDPFESAVVSEIVGRLHNDDSDRVHEDDLEGDPEAVRQLILDKVMGAPSLAADVVDSCNSCPFGHWRVVGFTDDGTPTTMPKPFWCCHPDHGNASKKVAADDQPYDQRPTWCPLDESLVVVLPAPRPTFDPVARAAEKQAARDADAEALATGTTTRAQLSEKNGFVSGRDAQVNWRSIKP